jgi:hypothetical protein
MRRSQVTVDLKPDLHRESEKGDGFGSGMGNTRKRKIVHDRAALECLNGRFWKLCG